MIVKEPLEEGKDIPETVEKAPEPESAEEPTSGNLQDDRNEIATKQVVNLRTAMKLIEQQIRELKVVTGRGEAGRYAALALTEAEQTRHWLGECLGALGVPSPYKQ